MTCSGSCMGSVHGATLGSSDSTKYAHEPSLKTICQELKLPTKKDLYIIIGVLIGIIAVFAVSGCPA